MVSATSTVLRYNYRIYPMPGQRIALAKAFGCARVVFNDFIRLKQDAYATITNLEEEMSFRSGMTPEEALAAAEKNRDALVSTESGGGSSDLGIGY